MRAAWHYTPRHGWSAGTRRPERLEIELAKLVAERRPGARVDELLRMPRPARSSWSIEDLRLRLDDGQALSLVWKDLGREAPRSQAWRVKPARVLDPGREPWMYETVLGPVGEGAPCWGTVSDPHDGVHWLFLEPVEGPPLCEIGDTDTWALAAAWLGGFHARFLGSPPHDGVLLQHDTALYDWLFCRALAAGDDRVVAFLADVAPTYRAAVSDVLDQPRTLLHGEFYPANILVDGGPPTRIVPVDWEMAGVGPAVLDLAALTSGGWNAEERVAFVDAYRAARLAAGAPCPAADRLLHLLDAAGLLLAVQWLAWAGDDPWEPPEELRNDWLEEAMRSARRLRAG